MENATELEDIQFEIDKSLRYHQRLRGSYDWRYKLVIFGVIASGSTAFSKIGGFSEWFGALAALLGTVELVFSFSHKARDHEMLYRRFSDLYAEMQNTVDPTDEQIRGWMKARVVIEADEPPILRALEAACYNDVLLAWGRDRNEMYKLGLAHRLFMNIWPFNGKNIPRPGVAVDPNANEPEETL